MQATFTLRQKGAKQHDLMGKTAMFVCLTLSYTVYCKMEGGSDLGINSKLISLVTVAKAASSSKRGGISGLWGISI